MDPSRPFWDRSFLFANTNVVILLAMLLPGISITWAEEAGTDTQASVESLLEKLASEDPTDRQLASGKLVAMGQSVQPKIEAALQQHKNNLDMTSQLKSILNKLVALKSTYRFDEPKTIDLDLQDVTVDYALKRLKSWFGWTVPITGSAGERKVTLALKGARFFQAVDEIRKAGRLGYLAGNSGGTKDVNELPFSLTELGEKGSAPACTQGPFLFFFTNTKLTITREMKTNEGNPVEQSNYFVQGKLIAEPDLTFSKVAIEASKFNTADGNDLTTTNPSLNNDHNMFLGSIQSAKSFSYYTHIKSAENVKGLLGWNGRLTVEAPSRIQSKKVELMAGKEKETVNIKDGTLVIHSVKKEGSNWKVHFNTTGFVSQIYSPGHGGMDSPGAMAFAEAGMMLGEFGGDDQKVPEKQAGLFFLDKDGNLLSKGGHSASGNGDRWDVTMTIQGEPIAALLQWHEDTFKRSYDLRIEGIPLP